jgi:HJR/Mrr/RecB family endonuclease
MKGLDVVENGGRMSERKEGKLPEKQVNIPSKGDIAMNMLSDNFGNILNLVSNIVEIKKTVVISDTILKKMEEDRKRLETEAQAYALKMGADTTAVVERMNVIREMMNDFYKHSNDKLTSEDFREIISEVVLQMGRIENGLR